jgi:cytidylate kinase
MVVAIDGPAGVGKSTVAREVARKVGFLYLNSGSFYRAVTWAVLGSGGDPENPSDVIDAARASRLEMRDGSLTLNGQDVEAAIHSDGVDRWVARHSSILEVRQIVNRRLRRIADGKDVVSDGRDIGTVVFPDAEVKVFLDADVKIRAGRRFRQGVSGLTLEEIERGIAERDRVDRSKAVGRLDMAKDAMYVDSSHLTIQQVCERVIQAILLRKNNLGDTRRV